MKTAETTAEQIQTPSHTAETYSEQHSSPAKQFHHDAHEMTHDLTHRALIQKALGGYYLKRDEFKNRYASWQDARQAAGEIKWEAINHLDRYLDEFAQKIAARGTQVFWAQDGDAARDYILEVCKKAGAKVIKSKTMTSEEIHLNEALIEQGFEVVESDLGEYIVQLREEAPYHFVFPSMHLTRQQISDVFQEKLGSEPTDSPEELTMIARRVLRGKYLEADVGITGANFAIAETGTISITENEGNARLTMSLPRVHIVLVGIEKVLPKLEDLALFLPMLATAGAGQPLTGYNTMLSGPRREDEPDGPDRNARCFAGQQSHRTACRPRTARRFALYSLRRLFKRVSDFQKRRRPRLRHNLSRADWRGYHAAFARIARVEAFVRRLVAVRRLHRGVSGEN